MANAANPPVETVPATTNARLAKQNGHIVYLSFLERDACLFLTRAGSSTQNL